MNEMHCPFVFIDYQRRLNNMLTCDHQLRKELRLINDVALNNGAAGDPTIIVVGPLVWIRGRVC